MIWYSFILILDMLTEHRANDVARQNQLEQPRVQLKAWYPWVQGLGETAVEWERHRKHTRWKCSDNQPAKEGYQYPQSRTHLVHHAVAMQASKGKHSIETCFDTDSASIGLDNRASACISHQSADFVGPLRESNRVIKSFGGGKTKSPMIGTLKWKWLDDDGKEHVAIIPNSYYVPEGKVRLLSPQH